MTMRRLLLLALLSLALPALVAAGERPVVAYYFVPDCPSCAATTLAVKRAEEEFADRYIFTYTDLNVDVNAFANYVQVLNRLGITKETPKLLIVLGDAYIAGGEEIQRRLPEFLRHPPPATGEATANDAAPADSLEAVIESAKQRAEFWALTFAAFWDGMNPCAFATVILFVAMLQANRRGRGVILQMGFAFILAIYLTYLGIGLAFYEVMEKLKPIRWLSHAINWGAVLFAGTAAVLSLVDAYRSRASSGKMLLVLPTGLRNRIRKLLRIAAHTRWVVPVAFGTGVLVSLLESACTGQVYFPTILLLMQNPEARTRGLRLLLRYNAVFIIPLVLVFVLALHGTASERIAALSRRHIVWTKLALALVFLGIAFWMGSTLLKQGELNEKNRPDASTPPSPTTDLGGREPTAR